MLTRALPMVLLVSGCWYVRQTPDPIVTDEATTDTVVTDDVATDTTETGLTDTPDDSGKTIPEEVRRVFVSSTTYQGDDLQNADTVCQQLANNAKLGGLWVAWVSTSTIEAGDKLDPDAGPFVLVDKAATVVARSVKDLLDRSLEAPIDVNAAGRRITTGTTEVWTGTNADGSGAVDNCLDWTVGTSAQNGAYGQLTEADNTWSRRFNGQCQSFNRIYCFER